MQYVKVKKRSLPLNGKVKHYKLQRSIERKYKIKLRNMSHQKNFVSKLKLIA